MYLAVINCLYVSILNNIWAKLYSIHDFPKWKDPWGQKCVLHYLFAQHLEQEQLSHTW